MRGSRGDGSRPRSEGWRPSVPWPARAPIYVASRGEEGGDALSSGGGGADGVPADGGVPASGRAMGLCQLVGSPPAARVLRRLQRIVPSTETRATTMATSARRATNPDPLVQEKPGESDGPGLGAVTAAVTVTVRLFEARPPSESVTVRSTV